MARLDCTAQFSGQRRQRPRQPAADSASDVEHGRGRQAADRSVARARARLLHRRDHGDQRQGPAGQHRRRRALRQPDRHVPRHARCRPAASRSGSSGFSSSCRSAACFRQRWSSRRSTSWSRRWTKAPRRAPWRPRPSCGSAGTLRVDLYPDVAKKMDKIFKHVDQRKAQLHRDPRQRRSGGRHGDGAKRRDEERQETMPSSATRHRSFRRAVSD